MIRLKPAYVPNVTKTCEKTKLTREGQVKLTVPERRTNCTEKMREFFDDYNEVFEKWSDQRLKINDMEKEILFLEAELRSEKRINSKTVEDDLRKALAEMDIAAERLRELESGEIAGTAPAASAAAGTGMKAEPVRQFLGTAEDVRSMEQSAREYLQFVRETYEEQEKLWEISYRRQSLHIDNLRERLKMEEVMLLKYTADLEEYKSKIQPFSVEV